jgi:hypothetical protein
MKKLLIVEICLLVLFGLCVVELSPFVRAVDAAEFQKAPDSCRNAHAILGWSDFKKGPDETDEQFGERTRQPWVKVGWVVGRLNWGRSEGNEQIKMVDSYEPGVVGQASFKEYRVDGHDNGKAYVAHCGHGGTCNLIAARVHRLYKGIGKPIVYCGENALPRVLINGAKASIPMPTEEELNETDDDGGDFDLGDDDDDDKKKDDKDKKKDPSPDDF